MLLAVEAAMPIVVALLPFAIVMAGAVSLFTWALRGFVRVVKSAVR